jgi:hypothetical protein
MNEQRLNDWINKILETEEDEISCSECFDLISSYVEHEESGKQRDQPGERIALHLKQCQACRDEYEMLRELAGLESARKSPSLDDLLDSIHPNASQ